MQVLIIDDNPTNLVLLKHMVARIEGCQPVVFPAAREALAWVDHNVPDIILTDYIMPDMDGLAFLAEMRRHPLHGDVPVVIVTTSDLKDVRLRALDMGATDFLTKPVDAAELQARIRNLMALRRSQAQLHDRAELLAEQVKEAVADLAEREKELIMRLSKAAEYRDPETGCHIERMANYCRLIAAEMKLPAELQEQIFLAAPMHDIGKVGVPDHILLKPGKLDQDEFAIMKRHAAMGGMILAGSSSKLIRMAAEIAASHHEKYDGSGYPVGLKGDQIPLSGRIVAVADVFDALTSARPYKPAWSMEQAVSFLEEQKGRHFDPACVDAFLSRLDEALKIKSRLGDEQPAARALSPVD